MFQYTTAPSEGPNSSIGSQLNNRGNVSTARRGGFEPKGGSKPPCDALMTASMADTTLAQTLVKLCQKRRISWRQLK